MSCSRKAIERILVSCSVYVQCQVMCYDDNLHDSLNRLISQLEEIENNSETPEDLLSQVTNRHVELLNLRMLLLRMKQDKPVVAKSEDCKQSIARDRLLGALLGSDVQPVKQETESDTQVISMPYFEEPVKEESGSEIQDVSMPYIDVPARQESQAISMSYYERPCMKRFTASSGLVRMCHYCKADHLTEFCSLNLQQKLDIINKDRSYSDVCLLQFDNSWKLPSNAPPERRKTPIKEPKVPSLNTPALLNVPPIIHPESSFVSLVYAPYDDRISYTPTVSVGVHNETCNALARALLKQECRISLVSPQLLAKLHVSPIKIAPIIVSQNEGESFTIDSYAILEVSSLYKKFRYKRLFYVADCTFYHAAATTPEVAKLAANRKVYISNDFFNGPSNIDLVIGKDQRLLTGYQFIDEERIELGTSRQLNLSAYYSYFGYVLFGFQKTSGNASTNARMDE